MDDESEETINEKIHRYLPIVQKWWDDEQVPLDSEKVQGENDLGLKWDELSGDHKSELILKIQAVSPSGVSYKKYGRFHADAYAHRLWRTLGEKSVFGVVDKEGLELKKELRKLGCIDPPGTIIHEGKRLWKDLSIPERLRIVGQRMEVDDEKKIDLGKKEIEKQKKIIKDLEKKQKLSWFSNFFD